MLAAFENTLSAPGERISTAFSGCGRFAVRGRASPGKRSGSTRAKEASAAQPLKAAANTIAALAGHGDRPRLESRAGKSVTQ